MLPCSDIQLAAVDDGWELKHDREPGLHPHTVRVPWVLLTDDKQLKKEQKKKNNDRIDYPHINKEELHYTSGLSATCLAHERMMRMASILVSGKAALQAYSDRHFMASWNESIVAVKCCLKIWSRAKEQQQYNYHYSTLSTVHWYHYTIHIYSYG